MKTKTLFVTQPHGAQLVSHVLDSGDAESPELTGNSLIEIRDIEAKPEAVLVLTGEELDNLAQQWVALRNLPRK